MQLYKVIENDQLALFLSGEMKFEDRTKFWEVLKEFESPDFKSMVVDCEQLEFIDSAGLALFLNAYDQFNGKGKKIILKNSKGQVERMFNLASFSSIFKIL